MSVQTGVAVDPLAEPGDQRRGLLRPAGVDVAEADHLAGAVGNLDPDRLLAGDRREDADVGRGERVGDVVGELGDFLDFGPGREAQLEAGDVRAADDADDLRLDPEVAERLDQLAADRFVVARVGAFVAFAALQQLRRRRPVVDLLRHRHAALGAHRGQAGVGAVAGIDHRDRVRRSRSSAARLCGAAPPPRPRPGGRGSSSRSRTRRRRPGSRIRPPRPEQRLVRNPRRPPGRSSSRRSRRRGSPPRPGLRGARASRRGSWRPSALPRRR